MDPQLIKHIRVLIGLSQFELAERLGLSQTTITRIETGVLVPSMQLIEKIEKVFQAEGVTQYDILLLQILLQQRYEQRNNQN